MENGSSSSLSEPSPLTPAPLFVATSSQVCLLLLETALPQLPPEWRSRS